jgi:hypothetical protein
MYGVMFNMSTGKSNSGQKKNRTEPNSGQREIENKFGKIRLHRYREKEIKNITFFLRFQSFVVGIWPYVLHGFQKSRQSAVAISEIKAF